MISAPRQLAALRGWPRTAAKLCEVITAVIPLFYESCAAIANDGLAGGLGFEPRYSESESDVLPLDDPPTKGLKFWPENRPGFALRPNFLQILFAGRSHLAVPSGEGK